MPRRRPALLPGIVRFSPSCRCRPSSPAAASLHTTTCAWCAATAARFPTCSPLQTERHEVESRAASSRAALSAAQTPCGWSICLQPRSFDAIGLAGGWGAVRQTGDGRGATERSGRSAPCAPGRHLRSAVERGTGIPRPPHHRRVGAGPDARLLAAHRKRSAQPNPIELRGVTAVRNRAVKAQMWTRPAPLLTLPRLPLKPPTLRRERPLPTRSAARFAGGAAADPGRGAGARTAGAASSSCRETLPHLRSARDGSRGRSGGARLAATSLYRLSARCPATAQFPATKHRDGCGESCRSAAVGEWMTLRLNQPPGAACWSWRSTTATAHRCPG